MGLDYVHSRGARSHLLVERKSGIPLDELNDDYFLPDHFLHDYFLPSKNRETLPSVEKKATTHLPRKYRNNREIKQSQRGKRFIATIPPTGVRRPYREPTGREPRVQDHTRSAICTDTLLPFPTFPTSPPIQGPPHSLPPPLLRSLFWGFQWDLVSFTQSLLISSIRFCSLHFPG